MCLSLVSFYVSGDRKCLEFLQILKPSTHWFVELNKEQQALLSRYDVHIQDSLTIIDW